MMGMLRMMMMMNRLGRISIVRKMTVRYSLSIRRQSGMGITFDTGRGSGVGNNGTRRTVQIR